MSTSERPNIRRRKEAHMYLCGHAARIPDDFLPETNQSSPVFSARSRGQDSSNQHQNSNCEQQHQKGTAETEPYKSWREGHMRKYEVVCAMWEQLNCGIQAYPLPEDIACKTAYLMQMHRSWKYISRRTWMIMLPGWD